MQFNFHYMNSNNTTHELYKLRFFKDYKGELGLSLKNIFSREFVELNDDLQQTNQNDKTPFKTMRSCRRFNFTS